MRPKRILGVCVCEYALRMHVFATAAFRLLRLATCMSVYAFTLISVPCFSSRSSIARRYFWFFVSTLLFRNELIERPKPMIQWTCTIFSDGLQRFDRCTKQSIVNFIYRILCELHSHSIEQQVTCDRQLPPTAFRFRTRMTSKQRLCERIRSIRQVNHSNSCFERLDSVAWVVCDDGCIDIYLYLTCVHAL